MTATVTSNSQTRKAEDLDALGSLVVSLAMSGEWSCQGLVRLLQYMRKRDDACCTMPCYAPEQETLEPRFECVFGLLPVSTRRQDASSFIQAQHWCYHSRRRTRHSQFARFPQCAHLRVVALTYFSSVIHMHSGNPSLERSQRLSKLHCRTATLTLMVSTVMTLAHVAPGRTAAARIEFA